MRINDLVRFIKEREKVRLNKEAGKPRPWTKDPILDKYRFCNVHREDDRVTKWLRENWYFHLADDLDVWFAAVVARLFNQPDALYDIMPNVLPWKPEKVRSILHKRRTAGKKNFNAAYIVSTNGVAMDKVDYVVTRVLGPLWAARKKITPNVMLLKDFYGQLIKFDGLGSFIAAQIIADLKYMPPFCECDDWMTFAASGPGSRRGLNRVLGHDPSAAITEANWRAALTSLQVGVNAQLRKAGMENLHAQDLQNCLCEFDKYERARLGEGTPKQIYKERTNAV